MIRIINNCPVAIEDIHNANTIYKCDVPTLKGKIVRKQLKRIQAEYIEVPDSFHQTIVNLTVSAEVMFVNGIPFVVSV